MSGEESLDIEWVHAIAPEASIVYAGAQNSLDAARSCAHPPDRQRTGGHHHQQLGSVRRRPAVWCMFRLMSARSCRHTAQGISVLFSSGDDGDVAALVGLGGGSFPASSPLRDRRGREPVLTCSTRRATSWNGVGDRTHGTLQGAIIQTGGTLVTGASFSNWPPEFLRIGWRTKPSVRPTSVSAGSSCPPRWQPRPSPPAAAPYRWALLAGSCRNISLVGDRTPA